MHYIKQKYNIPSQLEFTATMNKHAHRSLPQAEASPAKILGKNLRPSGPSSLQQAAHMVGHASVHAPMSGCRHRLHKHTLTHSPIPRLLTCTPPQPPPPLTGARPPRPAARPSPLPRQTPSPRPLLRPARRQRPLRPHRHRGLQGPHLGQRVTSACEWGGGGAHGGGARGGEEVEGVCMGQEQGRGGGGGRE
jgi:hypothetical protein